MADSGLKKWRKGVTKNRSGDKANLFGMAESMGRTKAARDVNTPASGAFEKMAGGMDRIVGPGTASERDKYAK